MRRNTAAKESNKSDWRSPGREVKALTRTLRDAVIAMPEPAFTAEPLRAGLVGDELRLTPVLTPARQKISRRPGPRCDRR
jgi:hypothetical protein